jgi:polysaccharide export outer membrane protein
MRISQKHYLFTLLSCLTLAACLSLPSGKLLAAEATASDEYRIGPLDMLEIKVMNADDLSRAVRVDANGDISLPLVGVVHASGLTSLGIEKVIGERLAADYMQNPQVSVFIREYTSQRMTVQGVVKRAGMYDFQGRATLLQAISMAGGLDEKADDTNVKVIRSKADKTAETIIFDMSAISANKISDPILQNGDIVIVEEASPISIEGAVRNPGNVYQHGQTTLMQVISRAGGLSDFASSSASILTDTGKGKRVTTEFDIDKIRDGKIKDPELHAGDLVVVGTNPLKAAIYGVTTTVRGFVSPIR